MKKIVFSFIMLAGLGAYAASGTINFPEIQQYQEKEYKKIKVSEVSKEAMDNIKKGYGSYMVKEAYKAEDGEYKLVLTKDGVDLTATFTSAGDLIKIIS